jgi:hypothetical protein
MHFSGILGYNVSANNLFRKYQARRIIHGIGIKNNSVSASKTSRVQIHSTDGRYKNFTCFLKLRTPALEEFVYFVNNNILSIQEQSLPSPQCKICYFPNFVTTIFVLIPAFYNDAKQQAKNNKKRKRKKNYLGKHFVFDL